MPSILLPAFGFLLVMFAATPLQAQISAFTYQGRLNLNGAPANGHYDFMFRLLNEPTNGVAAPVIPINLAVSVTNGLFTTGMDFGAETFDGANRWLEINVRTNGGGGAFTTLSPRQQITSTPYAIQSANAASADSVSGSVSAAQLTGIISSNNIGAGSITTVMLAAGAVGSNQLAAGAVTTGALADGAVTGAKVATVSEWFALTIANPTPTTGDSFGVSVAAVGTDRVLIGAPYDNTGATDAGAAYLFSAKGALLTTFTNLTPAASDYFGWTVTAVGMDRVLIGAPFEGVVYLFSTNGALLSMFTNPTQTGGNFGVSVAAVGTDRVLIGAPLDAAGAINAGAAYLFSANGALLTTLTNPTPAVNDYFGQTVTAMGTNHVLIGAYGDDAGAGDAGAAYLFSINGALLTTFTNPAPAVSDYFGHSVTTVGTNHVLIGAYGDDTGAGDAGTAYLFSTNGALLTTFTNPTPDASDWFGVSVAAVGDDRVLIAANGDDTGGQDAGSAYLFSTNGALLTTFTNPAPSASDNFGYSAAAGADWMLIGAVGDDTGAVSAGAVYLFSRETFTPGLVADGVNARSITTASFEDGAVTAAKIGGVLFAGQIPELDASKIAAGVLNTNRIPNLHASKITSGTLADARLSSNVALLTAHQVFTGSNRFAGVVELTNAANFLAGTFSGNGVGLTNLSAAQLTGTISSNSIAAGTISEVMLATGAVGSIQLADGAVTATKLATISDWFALTIGNPTVAVGDGFGTRVAALGTDRLLIGAWTDDTGAVDAGAAYLLSTNGVLLNAFTNPTPADYDQFGASVAAVGTDRVLIGSPYDDTGAPRAGAAYLLSTNATLLSTFINPTPAAYDNFGVALAAVGTELVLIGSPYDSTGASGAGAAYLFSTNGALLMTFTNPAPTSVDLFGSSVAAVGTDRVLIGAPGDSIGAVGDGAVYLFSTNGALLATFTNPTPAVSDQFGYSVAAVGTDRVLIGAIGGAGAAFLFNTNGVLLTTFINPAPAASDFFGYSVAVLGTDRVLVASPFDGTGATVGGAAYLFSTNGTWVTTFVNPTPEVGERFAYSVTTVGTDRILIGAYGEQVYLFSPETYTPGLIAEGVSAESITTVSLDDGAVTLAKLDPTIGVWTRAGDAVFRLSGNVGIGTSSFTSNRLQVAGMVGATAFSTISDRAAKQDFTAVDAQAVLAKVAALPITQWRFKEFPGTLHLGPMAQDFHVAFGLGMDDKSIATVDADGVALAAIQGLNQKLEETRAENEALKQRLAQLEQAIEKLGITETKP